MPLLPINTVLLISAKSRVQSCPNSSVIIKDVDEVTTTHYSLPTVSMLCAMGTTPEVETAPCEGRNPSIPQ